MKRILIACEYSGRVRDAFIARGFDAVSCDLLPTERPGPHYQGDVSDILEDGWDGMVAFPPCTHLSASGALYWPQKQADGRQQEAIAFVRLLVRSPITNIAIENPVGLLSTVWRKPDQIINPFQFGDPYKKKTCLWLKGWPPLQATNEVEPIGSWHHGAHYGGRRKDGTRKISAKPAANAWSAKDRSLTFQGIANAMAAQWGMFL